MSALTQTSRPSFMMILNAVREGFIFFFQQCCIVPSPLVLPSVYHPDFLCYYCIKILHVTSFSVVFFLEMLNVCYCNAQ